jgi:hypothetical protein
LIPRSWDCRFCDIAKPVASSAPLLIRKPEDKRCTDAARELWAPAKLFCANSDEVLVLIESICHLIYGAPLPREEIAILKNGCLNESVYISYKANIPLKSMTYTEIWAFFTI